MKYIATIAIVLFAAGLAFADEIVIWQEAESLADTGGWSNDPQHVDIMGSPYLLATGLGYPVKDAVGSISVPEDGNYRLWVRCRDWWTNGSPGRFKVSVDGEVSGVTFGQSDSDNWQWVEGGRFALKKGTAELRLIDESGWWGRCDAIVLSTGDFVPESDPDKLNQQRLDITGVSTSITDSDLFDVVVVGGGSSGLGAAIAAARNGIKVAFIQDRPVLGGNGSSEIMVPPVGKHGKVVDEANVTGIAEELYPVQQWTNFADSAHLHKIVEAEKNISLFLNTRAVDVEMADKKTISAVIGMNVHSGQRYRFRAPLFIDTTGHGWIGYYAGAEWRMGTEGKDEFGESMAPDQPNDYTMGNSLYRADFQDMGKPDIFETPTWAYQYDSPEDFKKTAPRVPEPVRPEGYNQATKGPGRPVAVTGSKRGGAFTWFVELGGARNTITDAEKIRDDLFRLHVGLWGYAKNYSQTGREANQNLRMVWLNYVPGVRESRRLIGDYIMTQKDFDDDIKHPDVVAFTEWGIDDHHPLGYFTDGIDAIHVYGGKRIGMPYRSFYSKNIDNLFMAGRCMSASHMALSGTRVQRPMVATGQVVGTAAALCRGYDTTPREIYRKHLNELQQTLIKDGCFIPGVKNTDSEDLALKAATKYPSLIDGWNRESKGLAKAVPWRGAPIEFTLPGTEKISCAHLTLSSRNSAVTFAVDAFVDGGWKQVAKTSGEEKLRRHVLNFDSVQTEKVRFRLLRSTSPVSLVEVRLYSDPGVETGTGLPERAGFPTDFDNSNKIREIKITEYPGIVIDDSGGEYTGSWTQSSFGSPVMGGSYHHDGDTRDGAASATFTATLPAPGEYEVRIAFVAYPNRSSKTPIEIQYAGGTKRMIINQREKLPIDGKFLSLGKFPFEKQARVSITNHETDGYVVVDGVQWLAE